MNGNGFGLPSNIKQIGVIGDGLRIYMEDYVNTYLRQYADAGEGRQAFLIGKSMVIDGAPHLFINGAVQGKHCAIEDGAEYLSDNSFEYAQEQIDRYFSGNTIVGWMRSQPGFGIQLNIQSSEFHGRRFRKAETVLFVMDPAERTNCFYTWNDEKSGLREIKGYFIYYEKNPGMQDYMMENKVIKLSFKERALLSAGGDKHESIGRAHNAGQPRNSIMDRPEKSGDNKRVVNMLVSLSAVLFVICFIMGAGLIQSDGRISKLEKNFVSLDSAYSYLLSETSRLMAQAVFAPENTAGSEIARQTERPLDVAGATARPTLIPISSTPTPPPVTPAPTDEITPQPTTNRVEQTESPAVSFNDNPLISPDVPESYIIQPGDNLFGISTWFYGTVDMVEAIMTLNNIDDPNLIYYGQTLLLPQE